MNAPSEHVADAKVTRLPSWSERNQKWLVAAIGGLRERLMAYVRDPARPRGAVPDSLEAVDEPGFVPALLRCATAFGLSPFERELLLLAVGVELDHGLRGVMASLQNGTSVRPSFGLALELLTQPHWDAMSPDASLRYWHLIEPEAGAALGQATLRVDERVLHFVTGVRASDRHLLGIARYVELPPSHRPVDADQTQRIAEALAGDSDASTIVVLHGEPPDAAALRVAALSATDHAGKPALWIAVHTLPNDAAELATLARHVEREVALNDAVPVLNIDSNAAETVALDFAGHLNCDLIWCGPPSAAFGAMPIPRRLRRFDIPPPDAAGTRRVLLQRWQNHVGANHNTAAERIDGNARTVAALERAAAQFHLGPSALDDIVASLDTVATADQHTAVWQAARQAARGGIDNLAQRILSKAGFDDLVLPPAQLAALRDIVQQLRHRERVYRDWGFGDKYARGLGLTALFAGESGTGKTLAAEAIANEIGLDLYRVDLATLVSKYIGETEKNLKRLFDAAEASGSVLLFDEADALFGKRSEVKDSHDRYANIEVAYLLQRVEAYRGLAILTTNMKSALDRAFLRRIRFVVTFPFPDAAAREQIWRRQFPATAPLGSIDFAALARLNLPGGNIHGIALNAAFKAADGSGCIDQAALMAAARAEFAKLERSFNEAAS